MFDAPDIVLTDDKAIVSRLAADNTLFLLELGAPAVPHQITIALSYWSPPTAPVAVDAVSSCALSPTDGKAVVLSQAWDISRNNTVPQLVEAAVTAFPQLSVLQSSNWQVWSAGKVLRADTSTLKRQHIAHSARLVIEYCSGQPPEPTPHRLLLYIYKRNVSNGTLSYAGCSALDGVSITTAALIAAAAATAQVPVEQARVAKWCREDECWRHVPPSLDGNIRSRPLTLRDGHVLAVTSALDIADIDDTFAIGLDAPAPNQAGGTTRARRRSATPEPVLRIALPKGV